MSQRARVKSGGADEPPSSDSSEIQNERVLVLVFESMKWDIQSLCSTASVNRRLRAVAKRLLWRELCSRRAPRMTAALAPTISRTAAGGGAWLTFAKLMFYCCGSGSSTGGDNFQPSPGHFVTATRFSKTSGRSFLPKGCRSDVLFVSDPCEHRTPARSNGCGGDDDLGIYRGVFEGFATSRTRACLIGRRAELDARVRCPYCGSRVWSMTAARLVPKSAARKLGSRDDAVDGGGSLEHFVCINGHLHGACWLVPLSSEDDDDDDDGGSEDEQEEEALGRHVSVV